MRESFTVFDYTWRFENLRLRADPPEDLDHVRQWVNALRSGDYKQGRQKLATRHSDGTYSHCCLGVACEVAGIPKGNDLDGLSILGVTFGVGSEASSALLPASAQVWLFGDKQNPAHHAYMEVIDLTQPALPITLPYMNDNGVTFEEIAYVIERSWLS